MDHNTIIAAFIGRSLAEMPAQAVYACAEGFARDAGPKTKIEGHVAALRGKRAPISGPRLAMLQALARILGEGGAVGARPRQGSEEEREERAQAFAESVCMEFCAGYIAPAKTRASPLAGACKRVLAAPAAELEAAGAAGAALAAALARPVGAQVVVHGTMVAEDAAELLINAYRAGALPAEITARLHAVFGPTKVPALA